MFKMMESVCIPHNNIPYNNLGYKLGCIMAVIHTQRLFTSLIMILVGVFNLSCTKK